MKNYRLTNENLISVALFIKILIDDKIVSEKKNEIPESSQSPGFTFE